MQHFSRRVLFYYSAALYPTAYPGTTLVLPLRELLALVPAQVSYAASLKKAEGVKNY